MTPASAVDAGSAELMLMLLGDARLPTGAHTQSAGLEPAMNAGLTVQQVPEYIAARLETVTAVEAGAAVVARHEALSTDPAGCRVRLAEIDVAWRARTISAAMRDASQIAARGYLRLLRGLWPDAPLVAVLAELRTPCRAVALGVAAALTGVSAAQLVRLVGNDDVATIAAAVLKVQPIDPVRATRWIIDAHRQINSLADDLALLTSAAEIPAQAAPLIEEWAEIHATTTQRLFRA